MKKDKPQKDLTKRRMLTLLECEEFYGVPAETVRKWCKRDPSIDGLPRLESFKPGKDILIYKEVFETYIKQFPVGA